MQPRCSRALASGTAMPAQALESLLIECLQWNDVENLFSFREIFFFVPLLRFDSKRELAWCFLPPYPLQSKLVIPRVFD